MTAGAAVLASACAAAPLVGSPPGSASTSVAIAAMPGSAAPKPAPEAFGVVSAIRSVFRERVGLPRGYMRAARAPSLVGVFAAQGAEGTVEVTPDAGLRVFSAQRGVPTGWPRGPEFPHRLPDTAVRPAGAPFGGPIAPHGIVRRASLDADRRLAQAPTGVVSDADPAPAFWRPLDPDRLMGAFSTPRGQGGFVRFAFPPSAATIVIALPPQPTDPEANPALSYILDLSSDNLLRVFNNPAATLTALFAGLGGDAFDPAPLAAAPAPTVLSGVIPRGFGGPPAGNPGAPGSGIPGLDGSGIGTPVGVVSGGIGGPGPGGSGPGNPGTGGPGLGGPSLGGPGMGGPGMGGGVTGGPGAVGGLGGTPPVAVIPLPAPILALLGAVGMLVLVGRRRRTAV